MTSLSLLPSPPLYLPLSPTAGGDIRCPLHSITYVVQPNKILIPILDFVENVFFGVTKCMLVYKRSVIWEIKYVPRFPIRELVQFAMYLFEKIA